MTSIDQYLGEQPFFAGLDSPVLSSLARHTNERELGAEEILLRHGDPAHEFFFIRSGRVAREVPALQGPPLIMESLGTGDVIGWSWLIPPYRWTFQARAEEPTRLLSFDGRAILARCDADAAFGYALLRRFSVLMSARLTRTRLRMMEQWSPSGFG